MHSRGISRSIPAAQRHHILERTAAISAWPGYFEINARMMKKQVIGITFNGGAGYLSLKLSACDDFEKQLIQLDRMLEHHINKARISASLALMKDNPPLEQWMWEVPDFLKIAIEKDNPKGISNLAQDFLESERMDKIKATLGRNKVILSSSSHTFKMRKLQLVSINHPDVRISWGSSHYYIKVSGLHLPRSIIDSAPGNKISKYIDIPIIHPEGIVKYISAAGPDMTFEIWKMKTVVAPPPITDLKDVLKAEEEALRKAEASCK